MIHKTFGTLVFLIIAIVFSSCQPCMDGQGEITTVTRELKDFSKLKINIPADVFLIVGGEPSIIIKTHENIIQKINSKVRGKTLHIDADRCIGSVDKLRVEIVINELSDISLNGSGSIKSTSKINTDKLSIEINGSGDIGLDLLANSIDSKINGSGDIILDGTTKNLRVKINGSGDFKGLSLQSYNTAVEVNGSGGVKVNSKTTLYVDVKGSGSVKYMGNPKIKTNITGSGQVKKVD